MFLTTNRLFHREYVSNSFSLDAISLQGIYFLLQGDTAFLVVGHAHHTKTRLISGKPKVTRFAHAVVQFENTEYALNNAARCREFTVRCFLIFRQRTVAIGAGQNPVFNVAFA